MPWLLYIGEAIGGAIVIVGLISTFIPVLPGTIIIFAGSLIWGWSSGFVHVDGRTILALGILAAASFLLGQLAGTVGAKVFKSSRWGVIGAAVGSILAIFGTAIMGPFSFVVFPLLFAFVFELIAGSSVKKSLKSGLGSAIGVLGGVVMQFIFGVVMVVILVRAIV